MPFKSEKQRKYLWAKEPAIAERWAKKYGSRIVKLKKKLKKMRGKNPNGQSRTI